MIFPGKPKNWEDLENKTRQIFMEAGCGATRSRSIKTVRGYADVDVVVRDKTRRPHALILCECKLWSKKVSKESVRAFRTIVHDSGAHLGFIISDSGFQSGAFEVAYKANIKLVTWKQFQAEMYDRWLLTLYARLTAVADTIYELQDSGFERSSHPTLVSEAINGGGDMASQEFDELTRRYFSFLFASSHFTPRPHLKFPFPGVDPRSPAHKPITFRSARMYFDIMFGMAPQAFSDYAKFVLKYTQGRCGTSEVLDDAIINQLIEGKTSADEVPCILGHRAWIRRIPDGEEWTFRGSVTHFQYPSKSSMDIGSSVTLGRTLTLAFGQNNILRRVAVESYKSSSPPSP